MTARGFTLIELLMATALVMVISGVLAALVGPLAAVIDRAHAGADMEAGTRTAIQHLTHDLREAGSDAAILPSHTRLARVVPPVVLLRDLASGEPAIPAAAIRVTAVPHLAAQGTLAGAAAVGDTVLSLETAFRCATGPPSCGFRTGQRAVLYTSATAHRVTIGDTGEGTVTLAAPLTIAFEADAVLAELDTVSYGIRDVGNGSHRLVRISSGGAEQPLLDNVVEFTITADTGDPHAPGRLSWILRVQAPSADLRGPAGYLFRQAGTATQGRRWLPDAEIRMAVTVRNEALPW